MQPPRSDIQRVFEIAGNGAARAQREIVHPAPLRSHTLLRYLTALLQYLPNFTRQPFGNTKRAFFIIQGSGK